MRLYFIMSKNFGPSLGELKLRNCPYDNASSLMEIWFDHGVSAEQDEQLKELLATYQPQVVAFNGEGITPNPIKYVCARLCWHLMLQGGLARRADSQSIPFGAQAAVGLEIRPPMNIVQQEPTLIFKWIIGFGTKASSFAP